MTASTGQSLAQCPPTQQPRSPFLSDIDFIDACRELETTVQQTNLGGELQITCHTTTDHVWLSIKRTIGFVSGAVATEELFEEADLDDALGFIPDPAEAEIQQTAAPSRTNVDYSVVLSPTYCVPVLYVHIGGVLSTSAMLDALYAKVVPPSLKSQLTGVSVMGAISPTNHPISNSPCLFVHPCRTADAMRAALPDRPVSAIEYLMVWIGMIGPSVGLYLPKETAMHATALASP